MLGTLTASLSASGKAGLKVSGKTVKTLKPVRMMFLGGDALEGPRHIWWNFVSSSKERIEQAKQDWKSGRFAPVPNEHEFIPLPE